MTGTLSWRLSAGAMAAAVMIMFPEVRADPAANGGEENASAEAAVIETGPGGEAAAGEPLAAERVSRGAVAGNTTATPDREPGQTPVLEAENIDLRRVVEIPAPPKPATDIAGSGGEDGAGTRPRVGPPVPDDLGSISLLGSRIPLRTSTRLAWSPSESFAGIAVPTPVLVVNGSQPGPILCLTAAIHGDELNGVEIVRRLIYEVDADKLKGAIIGVPIVNLQGFHRGSRYLTDRRDLNRHFPGNPRGSVASRIAHSFFEEIVRHCDALVDLHTGSFHRTNLPQVRADLTRPEVRRLSKKFGATVVLHTTGGEGTLRRAAVEAGIPAVTIEAGEPLRLQEREVEHGVKGLRRLLDQLDMYGRFSLWADPEPVYYESTWIRSDAGGILLSTVKLGAHVERGDVLGKVVDPITNTTSEIRVPFAGRVLGMAVNQVVMPGYAAYHIGVRAEPEVIHPATAESSAQDAGHEDATGGAGNANSAAPTVEIEKPVPAPEDPAEDIDE